MTLDPRLRAATVPGAQVWERSPFSEPGLDDRPMRGGTVLEFSPRTATVTFCSSTRVERQKKKQIQTVQVDTLGLAELDPAAIIPAGDRPYERVRLARTIFRAIGDSGARQRTGYDDRLLEWAQKLWELGDRRTASTPYDDCGGGVCTLFGERCEGCEDRAFLPLSG